MAPYAPCALHCHSTAGWSAEARNCSWRACQAARGSAPPRDAFTCGRSGPRRQMQAVRHPGCSRRVASGGVRSGCSRLVCQARLRRFRDCTLQAPVASAFIVTVRYTHLQRLRLKNGKLAVGHVRIDLLRRAAATATAVEPGLAHVLIRDQVAEDDDERLLMPQPGDVDAELHLRRV